MSIVFPKHNIKEETPVDPDRLNENAREFIQEVNGNLNETNLARNSLKTTDLATGALSRTHKAVTVARLNCLDGLEVHEMGTPYDSIGDGMYDVAYAIHPQTYDAGWLPRTASFKPADGELYTQPGSVIIPYNGNWTTVSSMEVVTREGLLWVLASWQQTYYVVGDRSGEVWRPNVTGTTAEIYADFGESSHHYAQMSSSHILNLQTRDRYRYVPGVQYCLSIDDGRIAETTVGGQDVSEDWYGGAYMTWHNPFVTDLVLPISAGKHKLTLQARIPEPKRSHPTFNQNHCGFVVAARELIALELS